MPDATLSADMDAFLITANDAAALAELGAQPANGNLTTIAGLTPTTDYFMQSKSGAWASRSVAQVMADLGLSGTNTGDQTITLTGDVTGSGTGSFATTIGAGKVTNAMLAGSIAAAKLVGTDITTVGTVTSGTWSTGAVIGGATMTVGSDATGDLYYRNASGVLTRLGIGSASQVLTVSGGLPSWATASAPAPTESMIIAVGDESTALTVGTAKVTFRMPYAFTLSAVRASLTVVSSGGIPTVNIKESGTTILSTKLTIDVGAKTSTTAATPAVISDSALANDAEITIDIDVAGTGAAGLKVYLIGTKT